MPKATVQGRELSTVELSWKEVFYTNCGMVSASNIDQELGWCKTDFKAMGVDYSYFRSRRENDWYPHYIHNLDNLIRFGGLYPPIHVEADIRRTRLLGATPTYEGGCMLVRAQGPDLQDEPPEGQAHRPVQEPQHAQERLVARHGALRHPQHAHAERHDHRRRRDRRVPVRGRLVQRPEDARAARQRDRALHGKDGPQAQPGLPPAGGGAARRARSMRSTRTARPGSTCRRTPGGSRRSRTCRATRTGACRRTTSPRSSPAAT